MLTTWLCLAASVAALSGEPAKRFEVRDAAIFADGRPFPLMMDFTWSAPHNQALFRFARQFGVNVHYCGAGFGVAADIDRAAIDRLYELAAAERVYICFGFSAAHGYRYIAEHPEAAMINAAGKPCGEGRVSYLEPGYRAALAESLRQLCEHVRGKPWHFGYYPQDEHSYSDLAGYEDASLKVFRERLVKKYGSLDAV
ncbi:MAG: hypothetical protein FJ278_01025, partial [Planctomycetes bacterium]|nr:hypothetical protein [Planctomycetota bacterium]